MQVPLDPAMVTSSEGLLAFVHQLIDGHHPGILTTMDTKGFPHARWMGTLSFEDFPRLYALTSPSSLKVIHLQKHPQVEWMFTDEDQSAVLNLKGRAAIFDEIRDMKRVWRMISDKSKAYFLDTFIKGAGFCVIETIVSRIECSLPKQDRRISMEVDPSPTLSPLQTTVLFSSSPDGNSTISLPEKM